MQQVFLGTNNKTLYIKCIGNITANICPSLNINISSYINNQDISNIILDMTSTIYVDSTFLGFIMKLNTTIQQSKSKITIYNLNQSCKDIFINMGLYPYFDNRTGEVEFPIMKQIEHEIALTEDFTLEAHEKLSQVPGNEEKFKSLNALLKKSIEERNRNSN